MAIEARRDCGYRKVGGLYLVSGGVGRACDRMPFPLDRCHCCGGGIKFTRGHTWLQPDFFTVHEGCQDDGPCPVCHNVPDFGPHMLLWIGRAHYSPETFLDESRRLGVSRRVAALPKGLVVGETWVLLAHIDAVPTKMGADRLPVCLHCGGERSAHVERLDGAVWCPEGAPERTYDPAEPTPGIFTAFIPRAVELILKESDATPERIEKEAKRGVSVVAVPDDDKDHQGSVWDKEDEQSALPGVS